MASTSKGILVLVLAALLLGPPACTRIEDIKIPDHSGTRPTARNVRWWKKRFQRYNKIAAYGNVDLVFLGDSITQNWERNGRKVWHEYYFNRRPVNFGINSDRTEHVLYRVENGNLDGISPKLIVLMIGTNNTSPPREIADGVMAIVKVLRRKAAQSKILMLGIFPRGSTADDKNRAANNAANAIFKTIADGNMIHYMDIGHIFTNPDGTISKKVMRDYVHLTPHGYRLWAEAIESKVARLMGEK